MQTIDKGLSLLQLFTESHAEMGLSELARCAGFNKATTHRFLMALEKHGLVEQNPLSRSYHLGPGVLRLARMREATFPAESLAQPVLEDLVATLGETAHFSLYSAGALATLGVVESIKSNRVILQKGDTIPLHATASGLAYLAFADESIVKSILQSPLKAYSTSTVIDAAEIAKRIRTIRRSGVAVAKNSYEDGVYGVGAAVFGGNGYASGAVAIAVPESRAQRQIIANIKPQVIRASIAISRAMGAEPDPVMTQSKRLRSP